jgi:hypothetical protein
MAELENLNIEWNIKRLVLLALNRYRTKKDAAKALGVSIKKLYTYQWQYNVQKVNGVYLIK